QKHLLSILHTYSDQIRTKAILIQNKYIMSNNCCNFDQIPTLMLIKKIYILIPTLKNKQGVNEKFNTIQICLILYQDQQQVDNYQINKEVKGHLYQVVLQLFQRKQILQKFDVHLQVL
ncbi:hypothetical protein IMG5_103750, partial [Ichthyophthirius multifiliis]